MSKSDFILKLLDLVFFFFNQTDNIICFVPTFCLYFCLCWGILTFLYRGCYRVWS